jgi:hypothetical protein
MLDSERAATDLIARRILGAFLVTFLAARHWTTAAVLLVLVLIFFYLLARSSEHAGRIVLPSLERIEQQAPR